MFYSLQKVSKMYLTQDFDPIWSSSQLKEASTSGQLPALEKNQEKSPSPRGFSAETIGAVGQKLGFLQAPQRPLVYSIFVTKGGVLKTSLALNLARLAALHNIKTLVIGLDMQCDITHALGYQGPEEDGIGENSHSSAIEDLVAQMDQTQGLFDFFSGQTALENLIEPSDLPQLDFIPETPELVALEQGLTHRSRREYWLAEKVIAPLTELGYQLIVLDCSPNWNHLITNALVASDVLLSPLECKINNFRNFRMFRSFVEEFRSEMGLDFEQIYIPSRLSPARKLSRDIHQWYLDRIPNCSPLAIQESLQGEEATALHLSLAEYAPGHPAARQMNSIIEKVWRPKAKSAKTSKASASGARSRRKTYGTLSV